ncbi:MAG: hypothetical protein WA009_05025, partial [Phototrophicaceae bacterium]
MTITRPAQQCAGRFYFEAAVECAFKPPVLNYPISAIGPYNVATCIPQDRSGSAQRKGSLWRSKQSLHSA